MKYPLDVLLGRCKVKTSYEAELTVRFIEAHATIAAIENGEDSAGRGALRLQTPAELVERSCAIADLLVQEFERREWIEEDSRSYADVSCARAEGDAKAADIRDDMERYLRKARRDAEAERDRK